MHFRGRPAPRAVSDGDGHYRIQGVPAGAHRLVASSVGFATDTIPVTVTDGGDAVVDMKLKEAAVVVAPVVISATRELQDRNEGSMTIDALSGQECLRDARRASCRDHEQTRRRAHVAVVG